MPHFPPKNCPTIGFLPLLRYPKSNGRGPQRSPRRPSTSAGRNYHPASGPLGEAPPYHHDSFKSDDRHPMEMPKNQGQNHQTARSVLWRWCWRTLSKLRKSSISLRLNHRTSTFPIDESRLSMKHHDFTQMTGVLGTL